MLTRLIRVTATDPDLIIRGRFLQGAALVIGSAAPLTSIAIWGHARVSVWLPGVLLLLTVLCFGAFVLARRGVVTPGGTAIVAVTLLLPLAIPTNLVLASSLGGVCWCLSSLQG